MSGNIPDWGFNSSFSITSTPVADQGFMPASILSGCILHQWIAFIEIHQIWLLHGSSLDFRRFISHPLCHPAPRSVVDKGLVLCLFSSWVFANIDSTYLCSVDLPWHGVGNRRDNPSRVAFLAGKPRQRSEPISGRSFQIGGGRLVPVPEKIQWKLRKFCCCAVVKVFPKQTASVWVKSCVRGPNFLTNLFCQGRELRESQSWILETNKFYSTTPSYLKFQSNESFLHRHWHLPLHCFMPAVVNVIWQVRKTPCYPWVKMKI